LDGESSEQGEGDPEPDAHLVVAIGDCFELGVAGGGVDFGVDVGAAVDELVVVDHG